ncbi:hypothetical protein EKE94_13245 [Mesobaculum littorinae]|uniref:DUF6473 domain-containing protein n=1 Tax=Mesobaculum littorinae TaxID=2486419 RepID=A0A438AFK0_9RHOB|nr:DUF6473 family protein [Mesobaculum littorinae]RVV97503.1 hypothetical protein EKE94_13245 [Mesobaculum littorinae]
MTGVMPVEANLDYKTCRYGASTLDFRGPPAAVQAPYTVVLGGDETFGRYVPQPYPAILGGETGRSVVNLGLPHAGPDVYLGCDAVLEMCRSAQSCVIQITGAQALSNRFYRVHPRRNDRFIGETPLLRAVYPEVDFTEFHFVRHMLMRLEAVSEERFAILRNDMRKTWVAQMNLLTSRIARPVTLLWLSSRVPDDPAEWMGAGDPPYVSAAELRDLRGRIDDIVEVTTAPLESEDLRGMVASEDDWPAARQLPGPALHSRIAAELAQVLDRRDRRNRRR